jgi:NAD-dependent DNA ligase
MNSERNELKQLAEEILFHRYCYYVLGMPQISDREYDALERELRKWDTEEQFEHILESVGSDRRADYPYADIYDERINAIKDAK